MCRVCLGPARLARPLPFYASGTPRSPAVAPAPLAPPGVAGQHGPGRGAAKDRQEAGEDGGQEEDGEAAEFGLQPPPPAPGQERRVRARGVPGARAGQAPGRRAPGTRGPEGGAAGPRSAPRGGRLASQGGRVRGAGGEVWEASGGGAPSQPLKTRRLLVHVRLDLQGWGPPGRLCVGRGGPGKEWETGAGKGLSEPLDSACAKARGEHWRPREWGPGDRGGKDSWVTREVGRNLS